MRRHDSPAPEISFEKRPLRPHTIASCFATYLVPHVLFVESLEKRRNIAKGCCLTWITRDGDAPPGFREGFADELRMLAAAKRDLFP